MGKTFYISEELANKLLSHLGNEPFVDVYELCDGLLHLKEVPVTQFPAQPESERK
jgi:hypothetical protein